MKNIITEYLLNCGFTDIQFFRDNGWYILAKYNNSTICVDVNDLVDEMLRKEIDR